MPRGVERLAVAPLGAGAVPASRGRLARRHDAARTSGWGTALGVDATVRVEGPPVARRGDRFRAGWVEAAELVAGTATRDHPVRPSGRRRGRRHRRSRGRRRPAPAARARRGPAGGRRRRRSRCRPPRSSPATGPSSPTASRPTDAAVPVTVTVASGTGLAPRRGARRRRVRRPTWPPRSAARGFDSVVGAAVPPGRGEATLAVGVVHAGADGRRAPRRATRRRRTKQAAKKAVKQAGRQAGSRARSRRAAKTGRSSRPRSRPKKRPPRKKQPSQEASTKKRSPRKRS